MVNRNGWLDWLRIERVVWTLDALVGSLPGRTRRAMRGEMRANLRAAAAEVGAAAAIRNLGGLRRLALDYLDAEYGQDLPRPRWLRAVFWVLATELWLLSVAFVGHAGFLTGVEAASPRPDGAYVWNGLPLLGIGGDVTYDNGETATFGLSFTTAALLPMVAALIIGGRLWRLPRIWLRRRRRA